MDRYIEIYNDKNAELKIKLVYYVQEYFTLDIFIRSGIFQGGSNFCINSNNLKNAIAKLNKMRSELTGECTIDDYDSNAYVNMVFCGDALIVSGCIGGDHEENYLKFSFDADQTILKLLADALALIVAKQSNND